MKFQFKIQQYQTDAVNSVVNIFSGQPYVDRVSYVRDLGLKQPRQEQTRVFVEHQQALLEDEVAAGFKNADIALQSDQLLLNIRSMQARNNIKQSDSLVNHLGKCSLDVEMETGTGKTYVYIKTVFELNKRYGWSKFIVVVPSIAIREGVKKTFAITQDHFMEHYGKKARYFVYNSKNLTELDNFSSNAGINVMIINIQAFNTSLKEDAKSKEARRIYDTLDDFGSRRPIDVIKANRPILILDEPQKMGGDKTQKALANFNPLFCLNYSATHAQHHNLVYVLDAVDAYNKRLVKKIEVKGFEVKNLRGTTKYLYLENILISPKKPPIAKIELEIKLKSGVIKRDTRTVGVDSSLYAISNYLEEYKNYHISEIDPIRGTVTFTNGHVLARGEVVGDVSEQDMRRIQIRETIISHFEKEKRLFELGIKTLSLFFIDEVAKYRAYNEAGEEVNSEYGEMFEQEYTNILNDYITLEDNPYIRYLKGIEPSATHTGYFSIDKQGRKVDSTIKRGSEESDDISAYDLILKNKERLLSFEEPVRFIFSHSALREGWDNPNVFQICTLKHGGSNPTQKRQEVGRGLRLCVNQQGVRMDVERIGETVHSINMLTVIASEGYRTFVADLQTGIKEALYERPAKASMEYFMGKTITVGDQTVILDVKLAKDIYRYLLKNDYIDDNDNVTREYRTDLSNNRLASLPESLAPLAAGVHTLIQSVFDKSVLDDMVEDGHKTKLENPFNDNFFKKEFQTLWSYINHQYAYTVEFDSQELIKKAIKHMNDNMFVSQLQYTIVTGKQIMNLHEEAIARKESFEQDHTSTKTLKHAATSQIKYDLIGKIAEGTTLTRRTVAAILAEIGNHIFAQFKHNPEEFISKAIRLIKEQKATMIVEYITYNQIEEQYDSSIFTMQKDEGDFAKAFRAKKHIQDYVFTDGTAEKSVERRFAEELDLADEVCVYAKLPKDFAIPTPVGSYSPDWAIAFYEGTVKHIYFIAETKGSMESMKLREIEKAKIDCAKKLFNEISTSKVKYHEVDSYQSLLNIMGKL